MNPIRQDLLLEVTIFRQQNFALLLEKGELCEAPRRRPQAKGALAGRDEGFAPRLRQREPHRIGGWPEAVTYGRLLTLRTHTRTSASTSGSTALTSCTVMPALIRGS